MTKGDALVLLWDLAAQAVATGGLHDKFTENQKYLDAIDLSTIKTEGQLLEAIELVKPKWKSL